VSNESQGSRIKEKARRGKRARFLKKRRGKEKEKRNGREVEKGRKEIDED
jgi:hypothetical protein